MFYMTLTINYQDFHHTLTLKSDIIDVLLGNFVGFQISELITIAPCLHYYFQRAIEIIL